MIYIVEYFNEDQEKWIILEKYEVIWEAIDYIDQLDLFTDYKNRLRKEGK